MRKNKNLIGSFQAQLYMASTTLHNNTEPFGCKSGFGIRVSNSLTLENLWHFLMQDIFRKHTVNLQCSKLREDMHCTHDICTN